MFLDAEALRGSASNIRFMVISCGAAYSGVHARLYVQFEAGGWSFPPDIMLGRQRLHTSVAITELLQMGVIEYYAAGASLGLCYV